MEPRALINENGNITRARPSVSSEMTEAMKADLISTSVRGRDSLAGTAGDWDDTEISSTYNSPNTTMNIGLLQAKTNENVREWIDDAAGVEEKNDDEDDGLSTPTALLNYDPATAATPMTPRVMGLGGKLVQMTAPPKQSNKGLFEDEEDEEKEKAQKVRDVKLKKELLEARRRTLGHKPRVGSPLAK